MSVKKTPTVKWDRVHIPKLPNKPPGRPKDVPYRAKEILAEIDKGKLDIRNVIRYAVRIGALTEQQGRDMETDQFRGWLIKQKDFDYHEAA